MKNPAHSRAASTLGRCEWALAAAVTLAAIYLHVLVLTHAGALWRDEAGGVQLYTLPNVSEAWRMLLVGSFPVLFPLVVRVWATLGLAGTDFELRCLGLLIGLFLLASIWVCNRMMGIKRPLLTLGLLGTNVQIIYWGDSLRGYGLSCAWWLLAAGLVWSFVRSPTLKLYLATSLVGTFAVQTSFQNSVFLLATLCTGTMIGLRRGQRRVALCTLALGVPAVLSLAPYAKLIGDSRDWMVLTKVGLSPTEFIATLAQTLDSTVEGFRWIWLGLFLLAVAAGCVSPGGVRDGDRSERGELRLFGAANLILGTIGFFVFQSLSNIDMCAWHCVPVIVFAAVCMEAALSDLLWHGRILRLLLVAVMFLVSLPTGARYVSCAQTNMDRVATEVTRWSGPEDLIVVSPWYLGVTFARYYHAKTPWTTAPALEDHRFPRYDFVRAKMQTEDPIQPVLTRIAMTLQAGNRVWLVGWIPLDGQAPPRLRPAPSDTCGWVEAYYREAWGAHVGYFVTTRAGQRAVVMAPSPNGVSPYENVSLLVVSGWKPPPPDSVRQ